MMRDLSEEGFAVRAMMPLRAGERTPFQFALSQSVRIEGEGEILWVAEDGRVAGVQFTQVSPAARGEIQEWLLRPETPPTREEGAEKSKQVSNPTLEELREQIHSVPARPEKTIQSEAPLPEAPAEEVAELDEPMSVAEPSVSAAAEVETPAANPGETENQEPEGPPLEMPPAPALPRLTLTPRGEDPLFHLSPATHLRAAHAPEEEAVRPGPLPELPSIPDMKSPGVETNLPDISSVLIQPSGRVGRQATSTLAVEAVPHWDAGAASGASGREKFSLGNAVTIMVILTLAAATYVFHRSVGQGLIRLGQAMGGVQPIPPQVSSAANASPVSETGPATTTSNSSSAPPPSAPATSGSEMAPGVTTSVGNSATPLSNTTPSPLSPAALLGGMSPPTSPGTEAGQAEYLQAMQILEGKPARGDSSEALRLLWLSVEKGNPSAELALAELYWRGRVVARNCEQTRILLTAAARKGSPEAQKRLEQFQREGCE